MSCKKHTYKFWKVIATVLAIVMAIPGLSIAFAEEATENIEVAYGDVNADEIINAKDALVVLQVAAKIETIDEAKTMIADVNTDEKVNATDALLILQMAAKLIDKFPIEEAVATATPEITETPATEAPATETPATEAPATETPATETPATEAPATETPATETPATEAPVTETPATEAPVTETPVTTETPATETPDLPLEGINVNLEVKDETYSAFWSIDSDLQVGDLVFGDRDVTFVTVDESLVGSEYIVTSCDSKFTTTDLAVVTARKDMVISVGFDARLAIIPEWAADFTKTEITCTNSRDVVFIIYQKELKAGESVTLGAQGQTKSVVGYIAIATSK